MTTFKKGQCVLIKNRFIPDEGDDIGIVIDYIEAFEGYIVFTMGPCYDIGFTVCNKFYKLVFEEDLEIADSKNYGFDSDIVYRHIPLNNFQYSSIYLVMYRFAYEYYKDLNIKYPLEFYTLFNNYLKSLDFKWGDVRRLKVKINGREIIGAIFPSSGISLNNTESVYFEGFNYFIYFDEDENFAWSYIDILDTEPIDWRQYYKKNPFVFDYFKDFIKHSNFKNIYSKQFMRDFFALDYSVKYPFGDFIHAKN